jgi:phenylalanyl-tRNA synthetase beta chain
MKISYNWLKEILDFKLDPIQTAEILTEIGLEVERVETYENIKGGLSGLLVGEILNVEKHPNADRLNITVVNIGEEINYKIVCGAPNVKEGQKVVVAKPDTIIYPINGEPFKIKKAKIRGEESCGMICAKDEIGLEDDHKGIIVLDNSAEIGTTAARYFNITSDTIFEIGLTPNRADAMSHYGVARDLMVGLKFKKLISSNTNLKDLPTNSELTFNKNNNIQINIENPKLCYRYSGIIIKNINVKPSPIWLKEKLESIGLKPINNIVDITNYTLHLYGQPLHAFDLDKISGDIINIKTPKKETSFITLDGTERKLHVEDVMICNGEKEMCLAGVFGGLDSGVSNSTKNIFIESALFNAVSIRKTAKRHGLNTDASFRYERGVDSNMVIPALIKASQLILELGGGEISSEIFDFYPEKQNDYTFEINFDNVRKIGGFNIDNHEIMEILNYLEIELEIVKGNIAKVLVPNYRNDIRREIDITEEVMRIYGYNNILIPEKINSTPSIPALKNNHTVQQKISNHLVSLGFHEMINNSLTKDLYVGNGENNKNKEIALLNPLSKDNSVLRETLIFGGVEATKHNHFNGNPNTKLFEWGKVYGKKNTHFIEKNNLLIIVSGLQNNEHWFNGKLQSSFFQIKGLVESIFKSFGVKFDLEILKSDNHFEEGIILKKGNKILSKIGLVKKDILNLVGFKEPCFVGEIDFDEFKQYVMNSKIKFNPINKFQNSYRDLSFLIKEEVTMNEILLIIKKLNSSILKTISLFDIYRDKKLKGKKSYGFRFEFLHSERTLKDEEVEKVMRKIQDILVQEFNAVLR